MKHLLLLLTLFLTSSYGGHAQMGRYGYFGSQQSSIPRGPGPEDQKEEPKTAEELVALEMPKIVETLELNAFEEAVVRTVLSKYVQQRIELQILALPKEQTQEALERIAENQKRDLQQGLPPEKFEEFMELMESGFDSKKARKSRQKKKKEKT